MDEVRVWSSTLPSYEAYIDDRNETLDGDEPNLAGLWHLDDSINADTTPPLITLNGNADITLGVGVEIYDELGATAIDHGLDHSIIDSGPDGKDGVYSGGDISVAVSTDVPVAISGDVDSYAIGDYEITYTATDAGGNTATATRLLRLLTTTWSQVPGNASDIGVGADGSVWAIDTNNSIWRHNGSTWDDMVGTAVRIDVNLSGNAWVVQENGQIWYGNGTPGDWSLEPGRAIDISSGGGQAWCIDQGNVIRRSQIGATATGLGIEWVDMGGHAKRIDAAPNGGAYLVTADGTVWYGDGTVGSWEPLPGALANDIGVGADGTVWITYADGGIGRWNATTSTWNRTDGRAQQISVGPDGMPWVVQEGTQIWKGSAHPPVYLDM